MKHGLIRFGLFGGNQFLPYCREREGYVKKASLKKSRMIQSLGTGPSKRSLTETRGAFGAVRGEYEPRQQKVCIRCPGDWTETEFPRIRVTTDYEPVFRKRKSTGNNRSRLDL